MAYTAPTSSSPVDPTKSCRAMYRRLETIRDPYLRRARSCAKVTIPWMLPDQGATGSTDLPTPFQSVGARGVNNLAARLLQALLPPNAPFFRFKVDAYALEKLTQLGPKARTETEQNLVKAEEAILTELETTGFRVAAYEAIRHLVVTGNALIYAPDEGKGNRVFHLDQYCLERDPTTGETFRIVICEKVSDDCLPKDLVSILPANVTRRGRAMLSVEKTRELYTHACRENNTWTVHQEVEGVEVPNSRGTYSRERFEYFPLRGNTISGEDYGRSYVEEYLGDLLSLEGLTQAIVEASAAAARIIPLVNPAGITDIEDVSKAGNGQYTPGVADDITIAGLDKYNDLQIAGNTSNALEQRLALAFLLNSAVQRQAERVTAEEIRYMVGELEQTLGGVYSLLSREFQLPVVKHFVALMTAQKRLPKIPQKYIKPTVVTGIEALGRGNDLNRLMAGNQAVVAVLGPERAVQYTHGRELVQRIYTAAGVRTEGLIKTEEELAQEQQQAQAQQMTSELGPNIVNQAGNLLKERMAGGQQQQPQE